MGGCAFYVETANQKWKRVGVVSGDSDTNDVYSPSLSKYQNLLKNVLLTSILLKFFDTFIIIQWILNCIDCIHKSSWWSEHVFSLFLKHKWFKWRNSLKCFSKSKLHDLVLNCILSLSFRTLKLHLLFKSLSGGWIVN